MTEKNNEHNFQQLLKTYQKQPIVLYVGAGSSMGDKGCELGIPGWWGLLKKILIKGAEDVSEEDIRTLGKEKDPWNAADFVINKLTGKRPRNRFQDILWEIIRDECHFPKRKSDESKKYKLINGEFLSQNMTLNAIVALCGGILALVDEKEKPTTSAEIKKKRPDVCYFVCRPNYRVRAVLTTNYDPFLEAAATSKYRYDLLKPVAAYGSDAGNIQQIPVFHIHGYVPHRDQAKDKAKARPYQKNLVLDRSSYMKAWKRTNVFKPTMVPQIHYLRGYSVLFIGFSFLDNEVNKLLKDIQQEVSHQLSHRKRNHFALLSSERFNARLKENPNFFSELGVVPITYSTPEEIPDRLRKLYQSGLDTDWTSDSIPIRWVKSRTHNASKREPYTISRSGYWNVLSKSRLCTVGRSDLAVKNI